MTENREESPSETIIVDEDWKARVQAEKEATSPPGAAPSADAAPDAASAEDDPVLPPPSLEFLFQSLAMQAMMGLGLMPNPASGKTEPRPNFAGHLIDTLDLLLAKTAGNRTEAETALLEALLHQLRMAFVSVGQAGGETAKS
jgi:hypothetical protein